MCLAKLIKLTKKTKTVVFSYENLTNKSFTIHTFNFKLKIKVITERHIFFELFSYGILRAVAL